MTYKAKDFIKAIPGTGGVITSIAMKIGCDWHTVRKYIDEYPTVQAVYQAERHKVTDKAKNNIIEAIVNDKDLATSKWWVTLMDDEFMPKSRQEITGKQGGPIVIVNWDDESENTD